LALRGLVLKNSFGSATAPQLEIPEILQALNGGEIDRIDTRYIARMNVMTGTGTSELCGRLSSIRNDKGNDP
jgi:hypothetical protein